MPKPGLAIYLHWPFCVAKCPYCDFNSQAAGAVDQDRWTRALIRELDHFAGMNQGRIVSSVFFGGGTPSLIDPDHLARLIAAIAGHWHVAPDAEVTLEANPGTVDAGRLAAFRQAGANRLSLGLQALDDQALRQLGRRHDLKEALRALEAARNTFERVSFDLIYARPGQTPTSWEEELGRALVLAPEHLSLYQLSIEDGTPFAARGIAAMEDDAAAHLFERTRALCAEAGLPAYEISNHARPGAECRHNLDIWRGGDYLGIGPGAHGRLGPVARRQIADPGRWLEGVERHGHATEEEETLTPRARAEELVMTGLRLTGGIDFETFAAAAGMTVSEVIDANGLARMSEAGLIVEDCAGIRATESGTLLLNRVIAALLGG